MIQIIRCHFDESSKCNQNATSAVSVCPQERDRTRRNRHLPWQQIVTSAGNIPSHSITSFVATLTSPCRHAAREVRATCTTLFARSSQNGPNVSDGDDSPDS